jgi:hypothetical protein
VAVPAEREKGAEMADVVMILITIAFFILSFALVKWFDLV